MVTHVRNVVLISFLVGICNGSISCGSNILEGAEKSEAAEDATVELEQKRPSKAISILEKALSKDPGNAQYLSILSTAYAQRAGVEPLSLAQSVADKGGSSGTNLTASSTADLVSLFKVVPEATTSTLADIDRAIAILSADLPRAQWLAGDSFKFALFQLASTVMHLKVLDTNQDGILSTSELLTLSGASTILSQILTASTLVNSGQSSTVSAQAAQVLSQQHAAIEAMPGATDDEKLRNYLAKSGGSPTALRLRDVDSP